MIQTGTISVELRGQDADPTCQERRLAQTVNLPWSKKAFCAEKELTRASLVAHETNSTSVEAVIVRVARARRWVNRLMAGGSLGEIAKQEGKCERQIRSLITLAFISPRRIRDIQAGKVALPGITELGRQVPVSWSSEAFS